MHLLNLHNLTVKEIPALELAPIAVHEIVIEVLFGALDVRMKHAKLWLSIEEKRGRQVLKNRKNGLERNI